VTRVKVYPTRKEAFDDITEAYVLETEMSDLRNRDDPDLNETVTMATDEANKRYILTCPDQIEGIRISYYYWE
jgi:hypothetical protein